MSDTHIQCVNQSYIEIDIQTAFDSYITTGSKEQSKGSLIDIENG